MKNKSHIHGMYGGVSRQNYYIPPASQEFVPQPARVPFTTADKAKLEIVAANIGFYSENAPNIMVRTSRTVGDVDVFTITTEANPDDKIIYTASTDVEEGGVNLNVVDAGYF